MNACVAITYLTRMLTPGYQPIGMSSGERDAVREGVTALRALANAAAAGPLMGRHDARDRIDTAIVSATDRGQKVAVVDLAALNVAVDALDTISRVPEPAPTAPTAKLMEALECAGVQFLAYAQAHRAKGTLEAELKADVNASYAAMITRVLRGSTS